MDSLFGISMSGIMLVMLALFAVCVAGIAIIFFSNRTMFRMGLRNIPRRGTQTVLVVVGLMLATLIITASFTTGDTIAYSFTKTTYDTLQRTDMRLDFGSANGDGTRGYASERLIPALEERFSGDADIDGFLPYLQESVPVVNPRTRLSEPAITLSGIDAVRQSEFGGLNTVDAGKADLAALGEGDALVNKSAADDLDVQAGDTITIYAQGREWPLRVAGIVEDEVGSGALRAGATESKAGGIAVLLSTAQNIAGHPEQVNWVSVALKGDVRSSMDRTDAAQPRLEEYLQSAEGKQAVGLGDFTVDVDPIKQDTVEFAETFSAVFTTIFLVLGLFSIAAGVLLIFMIFVMLAAERKTEMGMARAVGARRGNLIQMFVSEGMAYNVMAGAVGAALGVGAAFALVVVGIRQVVGDDASFLTAHVTPRTLVISYCLGVLITFVTVVVSSMRVSHLNIVAAIRGTDDMKGREPKRRTNWLWVAIGIPALIVPPLGLYWLLRKGFGLPSAWVWGPMGIITGVVLMLLGKSSDTLFPFSLGISLIPLSVAALASYYRAPGRITWTIVGALLAVYWLLPMDTHDAIFGTMQSDIEMFVLSGIMIVIGFTLLIVFNARVLTGLFTRSGDHGRAMIAPIALAAGAVASAAAGIALGDSGDGLGQLLYLLAAILAGGAVLSFVATAFPRFAPAMKMGVAYPIANRFRTGMTIAMFSLIVFSIVVMSTLNANFTAMFSGEDAKGGWDIVAESNNSNPVSDLRGELAQEGSFDVSQIVAAGRATAAPAETSEASEEVRQAGVQSDWERYPVRAGDDAFFANNQAKLDVRAAGYAGDNDVFEAVRTTPGLAIMDASPAVSDDFEGSDGWSVEGVKLTDKEFTPFDVEVRDPVTGKSGTVTVIGILTDKITFGLLPGVIVNESTYSAVYGTPDYRTTFFRLTSGTDGEVAAKGIKAAMLTKGVQATSIQEQIDEDSAESIGFMRIFQLFMGLGLFVGIAALGVIAFRAVVERRQQIGMLRAIGYQRGTVALTFLLESSFIALMGILSGVVGAAILARNLMTSESFAETATENFSFFIPWTEVIIFVAIAFVFSLLLTWWPSRGAAKVPVAEALRYE
jgi:putative ABC transport system permease protein